MTTSFTTSSFSSGNHQHLDEWRLALKEDIVSLLEHEEAEPDLVKQSHNLLSIYPLLESLKSRIQYPEEIPITDFPPLIQALEDASRTNDEIKTELQQLANYYRDFAQKFINSPQEVQRSLLTPKARIQGDLIGPYRVTQDVARKLLCRNRFGDIIKLNESGNHPVVAINGLHLKSATEVEPLDTGMEIGVYLLHTLLFGKEIGPGLAPSSLLTIENVEIEEPSTPLAGRDKDRFEEASGSNRRGSFFRRHPQYPLAGKPHAYALQASKTIEGQRLDEVLDQPVTFDEENFSSLILASFLTIPSDNKPDNFIVTHENGKLVAKIIGIDNDMVFAYPLTAYGQKNDHMIGLKNALLCFDKMMDKPIAPKVRDRIAKLDPILFGIEWAAAVMQQEQRFPSKSTNQVKLPLRFTKHTLRHLIENLQTLQKIVSNPDFNSVTHRQLFRLLFPVVERYYQKLSKETRSTTETIDNLFSSSLPSVEHYLKKDDRLEDGRTIKEALSSSDKRTFAYQEERNTSIEELCTEVLSSIDLSHLPPARQCALLSLAATHFPKLVKKELHPSWRSDALPFVMVYGNGDPKVFSFLQKLEIDLGKQNADGDTVVHLLVKQGQNPSKELLKHIPLEICNKQGNTPLDIAMEQQHVEVTRSLIDAGAGTSARSSIAWEFYNRVVKVKNDPHLTEAFQRLVQRNQGISWKMAMETIFPSQKGNGTPILATFLRGTRELHSDAIKQLWRKDGSFNAVNITGKRAVGKVTIEGFTLYFKQAPELAGVEQAVGTLMHQVMGFGTPHTDLVKIKGVPYLVSQGIQGQTLQDTLRKNPAQMQQLNKKRLSELLLMTMLTNPEDGKPDNLIVAPHPDGGYQIVSIDNDHAFVPSVAKEKLFGTRQTRVQVKTILYCLDQMKDPIDPSVREQFLNHDPAAILKEWLYHLSNVQCSYNEMFTEEERKELFEKHGTFIGIPLRTEMVSELYRKMVKMQFLLDQQKDNPNLSHMDLLMMLEPALGQRYYGGAGKNTPWERFLAIDGKDYTQSNNTFISTRQAREILQSYNITTKTDMQSLIARGTAINVVEALKVLEEVVGKDQKDHAQRHLLAAGEKVDLAALSTDQVAEILKKIDFSKLPIHVQQSILGQIKKFPFKSLCIRNASMVTNGYLRGLDFSQITTLELPGCQNLTEEVVGQIIRQAPELKKLNLSGISSFEKLTGGILSTHLELNKVTHLILNHCQKLQTLMIKGNQLAIVECEGNSLTGLAIDSTSLSHLNVQGNAQLTDAALDVTTVRCPNLKRLNIDGCDQINDKNLREKYPYYPMSALLGLSSQEKLNIFALLANELVTVRHAVNYFNLAFAKALKFNTSLKKLDWSLISLKRMGTEGARIIAEALKGSFTELVLKNNKIGPEEVKFIAEGLKTNAFLVELDLSSNELGSEGVNAIADALKTNTSLVKLELMSNEIGPEGGNAIAKVLINSPFLGDLDLSFNKIGDRGIKVLTVALKTNTSLKKLNLVQNEIGPEGAKAIGDALKFNTSLALLKLTFNKISDVGAKAIGDALKTNTSLKKLNLFENEIGPEGAKAIAKGLKANTSLTELYLGNNAIGPEGAKDLAEAMRFSTSLQVLHLKTNAEGAKAFAEALRFNTSLKELSLGSGLGNNIGLEAASALAEALKFNTSVEKLSFAIDIPIRIANISQFAEEKLVIEKAEKAIRDAMNEAGFEAVSEFWNFRRKGASSETNSSTSSLATFTSPDCMMLFTPTHPICVNPIQMGFEVNSDHEITPEALFIQGKVLEKTDLHETIDCYIEAAQQKHEGALKRLEELSESSLQAQYGLGRYYEIKNDLNQSAHYYAMAAAGTHLQAKQTLYRLAEHHPLAKSHLAILMEKGLGMKQDMEQALNLHKEAAEKGVGLSQLHLGILYHMGYSTEENKKLALTLIGQAESQGVPQAGKIKAQIQKEDLEKDKLIKKAATVEQSLYLLANRKVGTELFSQLPQFNKQAFSQSQIKIKKAQAEALERKKADLSQRIGELKAQENSATKIGQKFLQKQIEALQAELRSLDNTQKVQSDPAEEARQFFLNQKRQLFYSGFKNKITTICEAADAILSGDATRNSSFIEDQTTAAIVKGAQAAVKMGIKVAASAVPFAGSIVDVTGYAVEKYIKQKKDEEVNKQCRKIQGYYPEQGVKGLDQFSSLLASGLAYKFQDHIPHLQGESLERLTKHFVLSFTDYLFEKAPEDASHHELVMGGAYQKPTVLKDLFIKKQLKTNYGIEFSIDDLLFSTGVCTPYGGKYLPKDPKRRAFINEIEKKAKEHQIEYPIYRWGTKEEVEKLVNMGIDMECVEEERVGALATTIERTKAAARYMQEAESLADQFMEE